MSYRILFTICAVSVCASAAVAGERSRTPSNESNKVICRTIVETGSMLSRKRYCATAAEWAEIKRQSRQKTEHIQTNRPMGAPSGG